MCMNSKESDTAETERDNVIYPLFPDRLYKGGFSGLPAVHSSVHMWDRRQVAAYPLGRPVAGSSRIRTSMTEPACPKWTASASLLAAKWTCKLAHNVELRTMLGKATRKVLHFTRRIKYATDMVFQQQELATNRNRQERRNPRRALSS
jgi:hypothetical protein